MDESSRIKNDTLEDDVWKDSFDKLLDPRPVLRQLNIIKRDVRASFNMDSSIENCSGVSYDNTSVRSPLPRVHDSLSSNPLKIISTPCGKLKSDKPFRCSLSPIGSWKLHFCDGGNNSIDDTKLASNNVKDSGSIIENDAIESPKDLLSSRLRNILRRVRSTEHKVRKTTEDKFFIHPTITETADEVTEVTDREDTHAMKVDVPKKGRGHSLNVRREKYPRSVNIRRCTQYDGNRKTSSDWILPNHDIAMITQRIGNRKSLFFNRNDTPTFIGGDANAMQKDIWEERILECCKQEVVEAFSDIYPPIGMENCKKIGEGTYGEVFFNDLGNSKKSTVLKIIPIEGKQEVNGEAQKTYEQILPEVVISLELSNLRNWQNKQYATDGFIEIKKFAYVRGRYPAHLVKSWEDYDKERTSENDHPAIFSDTQLFIILELSYGGKDLESFVFNNAEQSYCTLQQIILTMAVAEETLEFEHRDLHWGNVLILATTEKQITYRLQNKAVTVHTKGVKATIIDYTLSRINCSKGCFYNDLSRDEDLFTASGDYQFNVYRMMRDALKNNWESFEPKTNVYWISYVLKKMITSCTYKNRKTKTHAKYLNKLKELDDVVLDFTSAMDCAKFVMKSI